MAKVEGLLAEAEADYRADQSTVQQIFNTQIIIEKHLQRQRDLFHNFIAVSYTHLTLPTNAEV